MKKQSLLKGTLILGAAGIIAKFLGLFFRWPLIMLIGDEGIGYYQMSYPLYMFFIGIASGGPVAISKLVSERNAMNDKEGIGKILKSSLIFMGMLGIGGTLCLLLLAKPIIGFLKWDSKAYYSIVGIAFAPMFISIVSCYRGFFQGLQNMNPTAKSQIIEQIGRVIVGVGLAYLLLPKGIEFSAGGGAFGAAAGGVLACIYLMSMFNKEKHKIFPRGYKLKSDVGVMGRLIYTAIPISLGATVGTIMSLIDSLLVPQKLLAAGFTHKEATMLFGQLSGKASVVVNIPLTISIALGASLVPIISEAFILRRKQEVFEKIALSFKLSFAIGLPSVLGLYALANPIMNMLFPGHADGYEILKYLSFSILFIILAQTTTSILQGTGHIYRPVLNLFIGCIVKVVLTWILVPIKSLNIYGAVIATVSAYIVAAVLNYRFMKRKLEVKVNLNDVLVKPAFASLIMIISVMASFTFLRNNSVGSSLACLISIVLGIIIYVVLIIILGVFSYNYIKEKLFRNKEKTS